MRITDKKLAALESKFGQPAAQLRTALEGNGLYRGAHLLAHLDTDTVRMDVLEDVVLDGEETTFNWSNSTKTGSLPPRTPPVLYVVGIDYGYQPLRGEYGIMWSPSEKNYFPTVFMAMSGKGKVADIIGRTEGEIWELTIDSVELCLPVFALTDAGLVTQSVYNQYFSPRGISKETTFEIGTKLSELKVTINDLLDFLTVSDDEVEGTKLFRRLAKQEVDILGNDIFTYLLTGELVASKLVPLDVTVAVEEATEEAMEAETEETAEPPEWEGMKASELKKYYTKMCDKHKVPEDDRETTVARIKEHLTAMFAPAEE